jgi:hypothetical protein
VRRALRGGAVDALDGDSSRSPHRTLAGRQGSPLVAQGLLEPRGGLSIHEGAIGTKRWRSQGVGMGPDRVSAAHHGGGRFGLGVCRLVARLSGTTSPPRPCGHEGGH